MFPKMDCGPTMLGLHSLLWEQENIPSRDEPQPQPRSVHGHFTSSPMAPCCGSPESLTAWKRGGLTVAPKKNDPMPTELAGDHLGQALFPFTCVLPELPPASQVETHYSPLIKGLGQREARGECDLWGAPEPPHISLTSGGLETNVSHVARQPCLYD